MWHALLVTTTYSVIAVVLQLGLALFLAYMLYQRIAGQELFRVLLFLPYITSTVASAAVWSYVYSPDNGLLNAILQRSWTASRCAGWASPWAYLLSSHSRLA